MPTQRNNADERESRMDILIERFQEAERRSLIKRGITLWTRTEKQMGIPFDVALPPNKVN